MVWWGKDKEKSSASTAKPEPSKAEKEVPQKTFDPDKLPERRKLPKKLQRIVDKADQDDSFYDELVSGYVPPSTESKIRYAAYATRLRTLLLSAHRYVAYTSDIGESFRPVAHPWLVRGAYAVSWAYILGDVSYEGYKAYLHSERTRNPALELTPRQRKALGIDESDASSATAASVAVAATADGNPKALTHGVVPPLEDYRTVIAQRAIFQSIASMGLPAFTIHSVVKYSGRAMKDVKNVRLRTWVPIGLGLSVVPFLPSLFDKPVENAVEWLFHKGFETVGGKEYVGHAKTTGREMEMSRKPHERKEKEE